MPIRQLPLTAAPSGGLNKPMPPRDNATSSKAEIAAAARATRRAVQEAEALRLNLLKRKAQTRAREAAKPEGSKTCR
ncbi:MAG: hypothetical protein POG74_11490 [Acidocella sp.]|nr:hypothetical protein [Acidocella sp.]